MRVVEKQSRVIAVEVGVVESNDSDLSWSVRWGKMMSLALL